MYMIIKYMHALHHFAFILVDLGFSRGQLEASGYYQ